MSIAIMLPLLVVARSSLSHAHPNAGSSINLFLAIACALIFAWWLRIPGRKERALEKRLRVIVKKENRADRSFRVEAEPERKRVVVQELEEARAMIDEKNEIEEDARREKI